MNSVLVDFTSKISFQKSRQTALAFTQNNICQEATFHYLLQAEQKRTQRSGQAHYILLVYRTDDKGVVVPMDSEVANEIFDALARGLRETDYIGWYCEGHIAGVVLTVVDQDSGDMHERFERRLKAIILDNVDKRSGSFQIRLCRHHDLQEMQLFGEKPVAVQQPVSLLKCEE